MGFMYLKSTLTYYAMTHKKEFYDTPMSKKFLKYAIEHLSVQDHHKNPILFIITKLNFGTCPGEYQVNRFEYKIGTSDELVDILFNMSLTHSISEISNGMFGNITMSFMETTFGSNIDADIIQMFVDKFNSPSVP